MKMNGTPLSFASRGQGVFRVELGQANLPTDAIVITYANRRVSLTEAGMVNLRIQDEAGSNAYHVPEGVLIAYTLGGAGRRIDKGISTVQIAPSILKNFGIAPASYMADAIPLGA